MSPKESDCVVGAGGSGREPRSPTLPEARGRNAQKLEAPGEGGRAFAEERSLVRPRAELTQTRSRAHSPLGLPVPLRLSEGNVGPCSVWNCPRTESLFTLQKTHDC